VRVNRPLPAIHQVGLAVRRSGAILREALLLAAPIAALESLGRYSPNDGADLISVCAAAVVVMLLARAVRIGWLPGTRRMALLVKVRGLALFRAISPRYAVAFRPTAEVVPVPDRTLLVPILGLTVALAGAAVLGPRLLDTLEFLKTSVSYTVYLVGLASLWSLLFVAIVLGAVVAGQWVQNLARKGPALVIPIAAAIAWIGSLLLVSVSPGLTPLAILLVIGALHARSLGAIPAQNYLFCRRDAQGRPRTIPVHIYLHRVHACIVLLLALIVVLGQSQRLWLANAPQSPFIFTTWLGILATLCSLLLVLRAGVHFQRILGGRRAPPETPLTPTLWIRTPDAPEEPWFRVARENGWLVLPTPGPPAHEFDLVLGDPSHPRRFIPRDSVNDEDARFLLERRFHVVMRRRFHRHFHSLYKRLRAEKPAEGSGYLFCPHVWLVPGVARDAEPSTAAKGKSSLAGPVFYGPPYAEAFPHRVRRYIGSVLRDLQVDIIYWEDAIGWPDIRRVLGVAFEIHDQRRSPLQARHFIGLPRVRVVIQEEEADPDPARNALRPRPPTFEKRAPGHARILLIVRDRGDHEELETLDPADNWIRTPSLV